jgi:hypothetical protein
MELRIDRLLASLRSQTPDVLRAIDEDDMLLKKEVAGLVQANASQLLYTPQHEHQLYAKGIVYRRDPYRLVSLPLIKIYNLGEREVTVADIADISEEEGVRLHFLRKLDGSLIQVFADSGRLWITTRGMIEGARAQDAGDSDTRAGFDYLGHARRLLGLRAPGLVARPELLGGKTLLFEFIHPGSPKITNYGDREDLVLIGCFDGEHVRYRSYESLRHIGEEFGLTVVDAWTPAGEDLPRQLDHLLASLQGTDEEGSVLTFEKDGEVIYRVKVKSPDYLRLLRAMACCTYDAVLAILKEHPEIAAWSDLEAHLRGLGREAVPEEILPFYRPHFEHYHAFRTTCEAVRVEAHRILDDLKKRMPADAEPGTSAYRKAFAALAVPTPFSALLFKALDGQLDLDRVCLHLRSLDEAREKLTQLRQAGP